MMWRDLTHQKVTNLQNTQLIKLVAKKKKKKSNQKMSRRHKEIFLQRCTDGQLTHEKMLNTTNY